jgi:multiple sugar transport system ATP-binding protein
MAEIVLDGVEKRFLDGTHAVRNASLTIRDGEFFILVGPSGCGKSTLLNMIVGLEEPTAGEIRVDGEVVNGVDPRDRNMAMVFQSYAIYPHMTVRENMAFPLKMAGVPREEAEERVRDAADLLELEALLDRKPAALSGGQRQRVAMGRAMVREPVAFLLDEPLSNLDAKLRVQMRTELARLQKRLETTTVYVTHDQTEAMTLGDHIAVLRKGRIQQVGTPRDLYTAPANLFVAGFIGSPAMNFFPALVQDDRLILPMMEISLPAQSAKATGATDAADGTKGTDVAGEGDGPFLAGVRPEHLRVAGEGDNGLSFSGRVELTEWMGADLYVHVQVEGKAEGLAGPEGALRDLFAELELEPPEEGELRLVARLDSEASVGAGDELTLSLDPGRVMLFDGASGERMGSG